MSDLVKELYDGDPFAELGRVNDTSAVNFLNGLKPYGLTRRMSVGELRCLTMMCACEIFQADYRPNKSLEPVQAVKSVRLLQWNIERGYKLEGIIEELRRVDADIIALQEVDIGCERTKSLDIGVTIAQALGLNYVFLSEFEEIRSPLRSPLLQGGGVHGNAILTKFDISDVESFPHRFFPVDWNDPEHPLVRKEPRRGARGVLRATVRLGNPRDSLVVYCAHLEVFCGMLGRIAQVSEIFADSRKMIRKGYDHLAILGDLNTMAHGIARLSPSYCCDRMRFLSLGSDEAVFWKRYVLAVRDPRYDLPATAASDIDNVHEDGATVEAMPPPVNEQLKKWGLPETVAGDALNPGFDCPFPASSTVTLDNPTYKVLGVSLMKGKLDWTLLRRCRVHKTDMGNLDFALSDHRWLAVDISLET